MAIIYPRSICRVYNLETRAKKQQDQEDKKNYKDETIRKHFPY